MQKRLRKTWREYCHCLHACRQDLNARHVHRARVRARRLIAFLRLYREAHDNTEIQEILGLAKKTLKVLGPLRDAQVQLEYIESDSRRKKELSPIVTVLKKRLRRDSKSVPSRLKSLEKRVLKRDPSIGTKGLDLTPQLLATPIRKNLTRIVKARKRALDGPPSDAHELRIQLKKLRYLIEPIQEVASLKKVPIARVKALQKTLGEAQDLDVFLEFLSSPALVKKLGSSSQTILIGARHRRDDLIRRGVLGSQGLERVIDVQVIKRLQKP